MLQELKLDFNKIGDAGAVGLGEGLKVRKLGHVTLRHKNGL